MMRCTRHSLALGLVSMLMMGCLNARKLPRRSGSGGEVAVGDAGLPDTGEPLTLDVGQPEPDPEPEPEPDPIDAGVAEADVGSDEPPLPEEGRTDGLACERDEECAGGFCIKEEEYGFPDGYCSTVGCDDRNDCHDDNSVCLHTRESAPFCVNLCDSDGDCRPGYDCTRVGRSTSVCLPGEPEAEGDRDRPDGFACEEDGQCIGGTCITEEMGFPGGYCTTLNCGDRDDCNGENTACYRGGRPNYCIQLCEDNEGCRDGYVCQVVQGGAYCAPGSAAASETCTPEPEDLPFPTVCDDELVSEEAFRGGQDRRRIRFELPEETTSFLVIPYTGGRAITGVELDLPGDGPSLDILEDYTFQSQNPTFLYSLHPMAFPATPQTLQMLPEGGGEVQMDFATDASICHVLLPKRGHGDRVDLRIHLTGLDNLRASNVIEDQNLQRALQRFDTVYRRVGIGLGNVEYVDVSDDVAAVYSVINSQDEAFELVSTTTDPGESVDDHLRLNVFFVRAFAVPGGDVLGISAGLPGAAGLHCTRGSGLVFSAETRQDPDLLGQVLAHEVGHFLGLPHTTEQGGSTIDPFDDTPTCPQLFRRGDECPDIDNLMFPFAADSRGELSEGQVVALQANPLVKGPDTWIPPEPLPVEGGEEGEGEPPPQEGDPGDGNNGFGGQP